MKRRLFAGFTLFALLLAFAAVAQAERFTDNGNGTITDQSTGLVWQKTSDGTTHFWSGAEYHCDSNAARLPGSGWRLPNIEEFRTIFGAVSVFLPNDYYYYWSASSEDSMPSGAWAVRTIGEEQYKYIGNKFKARCVRY